MNDYWQKIKHLFRNYILSSVCIGFSIYAIIYVAELPEKHLYRDDYTKVDEVARFRIGTDSVYVLKIENKNSTYISTIKK